MQNKGTIKLLAIIFALVCIYQLSFTFCSRRVEKQAKEYANHYSVFEKAKTIAGGNKTAEQLIIDSLINERENYFLDSMKSESAMNIIIRKYTYGECKERELNLGLDLKGGMNVTLEVSSADLIRVLSGNNQDPKFNEAIRMAIEKQKTSQTNFIDLFYESFKEIAPQEKLASFFLTTDLRDKINYNSTDEEVLRVIRRESGAAFDRTFQILRNRIDRFGVAQPNIQKLQANDRILIELPGIKDPARVRKLMQSVAQLEFWETWEFAEVYNYLETANERLAVIMDSKKADAELTTIEKISKEEEIVEKIEEDTAITSELDALLSSADVITDTTDKSFEEYAKKNPLFAYFKPAFVQDEKGNYYPGEGPIVGYAAARDTGRINNYLKQTINIFPQNMRFLWTFKPIDEKEGGNTFQLIAIKVTSRDKIAPIAGDVIIDAYQDFDQYGNSEVTMIMNSDGARIWKRLTADNIKRSIAIVLDEQVYSFPTVQQEIPTGRSSISGNFTVEEATDLANVLKSGKLPAPARIVEEAIVGPSLGREAVNNGLLSFILAFVLVLLYMLFFYNQAGFAANIALVVNVFFLFGVLASLQAVLTLPGIAGIVLTFGMSVDANVIIYERIKEELRAGKGARMAIADGYKNAYSAIIDGNVTTLLTGIVLYTFGSGPVQGFATTLIIGIITSLFCAIFITRLFFIWLLDKNKTIAFDNKYSKNFLANTVIDFISKRKPAYFISAVVLVVGIGFLFTKGLNYGVDFSGGRSYIVRFDKDVVTVNIMSAVENHTGVAPEVKTFGPASQVKITTSYLIDDTSEKADSTAERDIYESVKGFFNNPPSFEEFISDDDEKFIGRLSSQKVGPTIARDIKRGSVIAVIIALIIIFIYIAARFKKWQYGIGAIAALFHDALFAISLFSIFYGIFPFNLEIDQAFIAAILTIIGYSVNDTVIIFDRIREYKVLYPKRPVIRNINEALNSTLSRTINTAGTTFVVLLAIFIFGGEVIRGFAFALLVGVVVGTYSSIFIAAPLSYDLLNKDNPDVSEKR